jgi:putative ABC transport system permease protein
VVGVYRAFPPTDPLSEMVMTTSPLPPPIPPPDLYLARVRDGRDPTELAATVREGELGRRFTLNTIAERVDVQRRTLTALNLDGLSRIETTGAGVIAAIGVGVLGAFLVLERRREFALLRTVGADTRAVITGPMLEGSVAVVGSLVIGIPVGIGIGIISVRVLGLFFTLPPPLVTIPVTDLLGLSVLVLLASGVAVAIALRSVSRIEVASVLREP